MTIALQIPAPALSADIMAPCFISSASGDDVKAGLPNPAFELAKANYADAQVQTLAAGRVHDACEIASQNAMVGAPEPVEINYHSPGFSSRDGLFEMKAHDNTFMLTRDNFEDNLGDEIRDHPEYSAFCELMENWRSSIGFTRAKRNEAEAEAVFTKAVDLEVTAWHALAACPVNSTKQAQEKVHLLLPWAEGDPDLLLAIIAGLQADIALIGSTLGLEG